MWPQKGFKGFWRWMDDIQVVKTRGISVNAGFFPFSPHACTLPCGHKTEGILHSEKWHVQCFYCLNHSYFSSFFLFIYSTYRLVGNFATKSWIYLSRTDKTNKVQMFSTIIITSQELYCIVLKQTIINVLGLEAFSGLTRTFDFYLESLDGGKSSCGQQSKHAWALHKAWVAFLRCLCLF